MNRSMFSRRLLSSLTGSLVVVALMGCNALVGNEDITYADLSNPEDPPDDEPLPTDKDTGTVDTGVVDTGIDVTLKDAVSDQAVFDGPSEDGGSGGGDAAVGG